MHTIGIAQMQDSTECFRLFSRSAVLFIHPINAVEDFRYFGFLSVIHVGDSNTKLAKRFSQPRSCVFLAPGISPVPFQRPVSS